MDYTPEQVAAFLSHLDEIETFIHHTTSVLTPTFFIPGHSSLEEGHTLTNLNSRATKTINQTSVSAVLLDMWIDIEVARKATLTIGEDLALMYYFYLYASDPSGYVVPPEHTRAIAYESFEKVLAYLNGEPYYGG